MSALNPGIVKTVEWLNARGFTTCDSGDGETHDFACDLDIPYVHMTVPAFSLALEAMRLKELLEAIGVRIVEAGPDASAQTIAATYDPANGVAVLSLFNVRLT